jgi:uncharacterized protein involved in exopolysaccharide biosynthesis
MMGIFSISKWRRAIVLCRIVFLLSFVLISAAGLSAMWYLGRVVSPASGTEKWYLPKRVYEVQGAIRVAPVSAMVLRGADDRKGVTEYQSFMNTQAEMITSQRVVQRVADDLAGKDLTFFENYGGLSTESRGKDDDSALAYGPAGVLKRAIRKGVIEASVVEKTELIKVTMRSRNPEEARQIVDSFISNYMSVEVAAAARRDDQKLSVLENESKVLARKLQSSREKIRQLAKEFGTTTLDDRQELMLRRVTELQRELTQTEASRIKLEGRVVSLEKGGDGSLVRVAGELQRERERYISSDVSVEALARRIADVEVDYVVAEVEGSAEDTAVKRKAKVLEVLESRLQKRKQEAGKAFDEMVAKREAQAHAQKLLKAKVELEQIKAQEKSLRELLASEDSRAIDFGRRELDIQELQAQLELDKEIYDKVCRRVKELEMERKNPARISVAYFADVASVSVGAIRFKAAVVVLLGALVCSVLLALIAGLSSRKSNTPEK